MATDGQDKKRLIQPRYIHWPTSPSPKPSNPMASMIVICIFLGVYLLVAEYPSKKRFRWLKWLLVGLGVVLTIRFAIYVWF